jgi:thiamine monophosphate synthase
VVAIGGLSADNATAAVAVGAAGVAVVRALLDASDVVAAARRLRAEVERGLRERGETR